MSEHHHRHRDVSGGAARAAVLGAGDGLLTNVSLILGVAGASTAGTYVRLAGIAGLLAGAFSMGAGELVSMRAQRELVDSEIARESAELHANPDEERAELAAMYRARGVTADEADTVARILSGDHALALDTHVRLELGVDPGSTATAWKPAAASFVAFASGALLPLLPWLVGGGSAAVAASVLVAAVAALALGAAIGVSTGQSWARTAARQLLVATVSAVVTYGIGHLVGVAAT